MKSLKIAQSIQSEGRREMVVRFPGFIQIVILN